jgi:hypothetical protein
VSREARTLAAGVLAAALFAAGPALGAPEGQLTLATHFTLAPTFFDPAETPGIITPFMILYALHDALVKPMPGKVMAPSLAESWTVSSDGLVYDFVLRKGARFHTGEPVTAEDVKFSFERYRGIFNRTLKDHVAGVETPDAAHVRFRLKKPWPDFLLHYGTPATGAGWIVPKKYVEKVGDDGFKKAPVGAGPYRFVSSTPGVELVLDAFDGYWRKDAGGQAPGVQGSAGRLDAAGHAQARGHRHRLRLRRHAGRRGATHAGPDAPRGALHEHALAGLRRSVGPEVPVARSPRAAGRQSRRQPSGDQPGGGPRLRTAHQQHHSDELRLLLAAAPTGPRSGTRAAAAGRGRVPRRLRRRRLLV